METSVTSRVQNVLISGCGVAGPALAYWLHRYGFTPTVVERAPQIRTGGYRLQLDAIVQEPLNRLGILSEARAVGGGLVSMRLISGPNNRAATYPASPSDTSLAIRRGDLSELIYRRSKDTVEYIFGDAITAIEQRPGGARVEFEHAPAREFDLVIGADGLHSTVRELVFGTKDRFLRYMDSYLFLTAIDNYLGVRDLLTVRREHRRGSALTTFPGNEELELLFMVRTHEPPGPGPRDEQTQKQLMDSAFAADGWEAPTMLHKMWDASDYYFGRVAQVRMDRWVQGRVALVGDAGYCPDPMTGAGTASALVGACVLAGELAAAGGDHSIALPSYQSKVAKFVRGNQDFVDTSLDLFASAAKDDKRFRMENLMYSGMLRAAALAARFGVDATGYSRATKQIQLPDYSQYVTR